MPAADLYNCDMHSYENKNTPIEAIDAFEWFIRQIEGKTIAINYNWPNHSHKIYESNAQHIKLRKKMSWHLSKWLNSELKKLTNNTLNK